METGGMGNFLVMTVPTSTALSKHYRTSNLTLLDIKLEEAVTAFEDRRLTNNSASPHGDAFRKLSSKTMRRKIIAFWCTVAVILVLSLHLFIGISFLAWYRKQKHIIAERICPFVPRIYKGPDVNKIIGMLLEMDNSELLMMLIDEGLLRSRINEAAAVLAAAKI